MSFFTHYWDKIVIASVAVYGAVLSTYTYIQNRKREERDRRKDEQEQEKTRREEDAELARVLWETSELKGKVIFLDDWIWKKQSFTRHPTILEALSLIRDYWKKNDEALRRFLGPDARTYKALLGLCDVALQNEDNQPPPNGQGVWRGITQENLLGFTVEQLIYHVETELKKRRG